MTCLSAARSFGPSIVALLIFFLLQLPAIGQEGRLEVIQVFSKGLAGNLLGDSPNRNVTVYLPSEYDEAVEKRFAVVYLLHGYMGKNTLWTGEGYVKNLHIDRIADRLIASGDIEPMILVAPDCHNKYRGSWYTNSPVTGKWEDFVTKDLILHIDGNYRTIRKSASRAIVGHSMGGHGAIKLAMKHPELYCCLYAMSPAAVDFGETLQSPFTKDFKDAAAVKTENAFPALFWRARAMIALAAAVAPDANGRPFLGELPLDANGNRVERVWKRWLEHDLSGAMLEKYRDNLRQYKAIAVDCGTKETLLATDRAFVKALRNAGIEHTYEEFDGTHTDHVVSQLEEKVLPLFSKTLEHSELQPAAATVP